VGQHIRLDNRTGTPVEIVGVAQTIKYQSGASGRAIDFVYLPLAQHPVTRMVLLVRAAGDPLELVKPVKDVVRRSIRTCRCWKRDPTRNCTGMRPSKGRGSRLNWWGRWVRSVSCWRSPVCTGWWPTTSAAERARSHPDGPWRRSADVLRLVMGKGLVLVGTGTAIGLVMSVAVEQLMNSMVFNAGGIDIIALSRRRAVDDVGNDAGGLRARAPGFPDRADTGLAI